MGRMDLYELEAFVTVAEERSFSRAALRLNRTQPAVSQTIRRLEDDVGARLLDRSGREASLTAAGRVLLGHAEKLLRLRGEAQKALSDLHGRRAGRLAIAANEFSALHLVRVLSDYRLRYPKIEIAVGRLLASRIPPAVVSHEWELGVVNYRPLEPELQSVRVYRDRLALVLAPDHRLARRRRVRIRDLGGETFIAHNVPSPLRAEVIAAFRRHRTPLHMEIEMPTLEAIRRCVASGMGIALTPRISVEAELARGELFELDLHELRLEHHLRVIYRRGSPLSQAAQALLELLAKRAHRGGVEQYVEEGE